MSITNLNQFHNQVMQDETLQQKLVAAPDKEQLSRLAVEPGRNLSLEFNEAEVLDSDYSGELDESELDAVAGGVGVYWNQEGPEGATLNLPDYNDPIDGPDDRKCVRAVRPGGRKMPHNR